MDFENFIIGCIFLLSGITIFVYKFRYHTIEENEKYARINGDLFVFGVGLVLFAIHLIWIEIEKIL